MREIAVAERTVVIQACKTTTVERQYCGMLDNEGIFHLRQYWGKRFVTTSVSGIGSGMVPKNQKKADTAA